MCLPIKRQTKTMNSIDCWTNGILGEAVLFPVRYMCLGSICSCVFTWHYDSAYRSECVLAVQTCIFVDFVCFQNMNSNKLCVYQAFRHTCFGGACMFISRTEIYSRAYSLLKGYASNMLWMCVCVCLPGIQTYMYWRS